MKKSLKDALLASLGLVVLCNFSKEWLGCAFHRAFASVLQSIQEKSGKMLKEVDLLREKVRDFDGRIGVGAAANFKYVWKQQQLQLQIYFPLDR